MNDREFPSFKHQYHTYSPSKTLMIQGCTSDAGKSIMVSGICRVLANKGIKVAPFKPQNMSLNSAVTQDGGEIGRAQALQAQACYLPPHSDMNPVLLKPTSDIDAQVILQGKALHDMQANDYHDYKTKALSAVMQSYKRLQQQYDYTVVEGAGSPAEINLRDKDIANMGFAEQANCPVIIVADIDRGGVFAHLVGTLMLLSQSEQNRVIGFIINRFRGDISLLQSGLEWLEARTQKPVIGVIPYLKNLFLDAEDALSTHNTLDCSQPLKVMVPVLPKISNHTDFDSLRLHPQVDFQFIHAQHSIQQADLVILPGSKNTIKDTHFLIQNGWKEKLQQHLNKGGKIIGICGGLQMLGKHIFDPQGVENQGNTQQIEGFNLLPIKTTLQPSKKLAQVRGKLMLNNVNNTPIAGYEIHCGQSHQINSENTSLTAFCKIGEKEEGYINAQANIIGTYLHGVFDHPDAVKVLLTWAGLPNAKTIDIANVREQQLERLAQCLQDNIKPYFWQTLTHK